MILDTNFISALADGDALALATLNRDEVWVPAIVLGEYLAGLGHSKRRNEGLAWVAEYLDHEEVVLVITQTTAHHYANIWNELKVMGRPIPQNDLWIAALAREHQMPVVSQDTHFDHVPGITRIGW